MFVVVVLLGRRGTSSLTVCCGRQRFMVIARSFKNDDDEDQRGVLVEGHGLLWKSRQLTVEVYSLLVDLRASLGVELFFS